MRKVLVALLLGLAAPPAMAVAPEQAAPIYREGEVLVRYRASALDAPAQALRARLGLRSVRTLLRGRAELVALPQVTTTQAALAVLRRDPAVAHAEPNFLRRPRALPNDPLFNELWGLHSTGQANYASSDPALASIPGADMDMVKAWDPGGDGVYERVGDPGVIIAIVDDSVTTNHPDLSANMLAGFDFANGDTNPNPDGGTDESHGTMVAGAAGAVGNNGIGVAGTAWNAKLLPLKFDFDTAGHIAALAFARDQGAKIVNASFGGPGFSQTELDAILDLANNDILYVAAAGNDDSNTDIAELNYPANLDAPNIVSVAATNRQDSIASFSQYGAITVDVAAPGLQIVTTANTSAGSYRLPPGTSGTSFSAPYTAGVAALIRSVHAGADFTEVKARLIEGAEPGDQVDLRTAGGRVNAANSLDLAARPALVIEAVDWTDANQALDPGEALSVDITIRNLWVEATSVTGTLAADNGVTVTSGAVAFGTVAAGGTATARFDVSVAAGITQHRYVHFTLDLGADGGYSATRGFIGEIGRLSNDVVVTQAFAARSVDLYDEFHAWHYDFGALPAGHTQLVIETTSSSGALTSPDIDLLVKRNTPPRYNITVGTNPEAPGFFCTSGTTGNCQDPAVFLSAGANGDEQVVISNPQAGTYHIVIVNFAQLDEGLTYTLRAYTRAGGQTTGGGGGGGPVPPTPLAMLLALALSRRLLRRQ